MTVDQAASGAETSGRKPDRGFFVIVALLALLFALKLASASTMELRTDEAYHWTWSKEWVLSYLDHPPMIAWVVRLGTSLFGDTLLGVRFGNIAAMLGAQLLLADIVRRRTGSLATAALAMLAMESTVHLGGISVIVEPSIPLILFISLMFWALCRLEDSGKAGWWLLIGLAAGLALLSKYMALLFIPAVLAYLLVTARNRRWLSTPWPWVAAALAVVVFSPVIWWNLQNDWASFRFQGGRAVEGRTIDLRGIADFLALNLLLVGPIMLFVLAISTTLAALRARRDGDGTTLALAVAFLFFFGFLLVRSLTLRINTSWPIAAWPFGIAATVITLHNRAAGLIGGRSSIGRRFLIAAICVNLPLLLLLHWHVNVDRAAWGRSDPIGRDDGYAQVADAVLALANAGDVRWVATTDYRTYAIMRWLLRDHLPVVQVNQRSRYIGFEVPAAVGAPGAYVYEKGRQDALVPATVVGQPINVERRWRGVTYGTYEVRPFLEWLPNLTPPPGSPPFAWPDLV